MNATILYISAPWCMECKAMAPHLETVADEFADTVTLEKVDVAESPEAAARLKVMATPTLIGRSDDQELFRVSGRRTPIELRGLFEAAAAGSAEVSVGAADRALRVGSGAALAIVGALVGPAWPLVAVGVAIAGWGFATGSGR